MTEFFFPDNTVLCNFAAVGRLDLLKAVLSGRGRWTDAVAYEASRSAAYLAPLGSLPNDGWLGDPIEISDEADIRRVNHLRRAVFGGTDERPLQHLGEAQTCYIICEWPQFAGSWWISDDRESLRYARSRYITTRETIDLVGVAVVNGDIEPSEGYKLMQQMTTNGRVLRLPKAPADLRR